ncbi:hypothetical protein DFJ74DRAFT_656721 [Hyaloraphidium curvatum]|nr:hypothetical protein DFJ74DRAFT_656721 [Hyaloraphidium curvatum]
MSTQSGIKPSADLAAVFADATNASTPTTTRAIAVAIENESMVISKTSPSSGDWESDWEAAVAPLAEEKAPRLILYRTDKRSAKVGWEWIVLEWVPEGARVRDKMLVAASKATLTKSLGQAAFVDSLYATTATDLSLESYKKHLESKAAGGPLSETEKMLLQVKLEEQQAEQIAQRRTPVPSARVTAPIDTDAKSALEGFDKNKLNLVVLLVDGETIKLDKDPVSEPVSTKDIGSHVPAAEPRFVVFRYQRRGDSNGGGHILFFYCCPPSAKIKLKMVYSSSKAGLLTFLEKDAGLILARKYEVDGPAEITDELIEPDLESAKASSSAAAAPASPAKLAFKRPAAPGRPRSAASNEGEASGGSVSSRVAAFENLEREVRQPAPKPAAAKAKPATKVEPAKVEPEGKKEEPVAAEPEPTSASAEEVPDAAPKPTEAPAEEVPDAAPASAEEAPRETGSEEGKEPEAPIAVAEATKEEASKPDENDEPVKDDEWD